MALRNGVLIELRDVEVGFSGEMVLAGVSMQVFAGDTIVIIGPSGGGKSVLLKTMAGVYAPTKGEVLYLGREWQAISSEERHDLARTIGVQFQKSALFDSMSVFDNVAFPLREHTTMSEHEIEERVMECLTAVDLGKARKLATFELSGGMQQRAGIARAIALRPSVLFLDDPTAGLDPVNSDSMAELILDLKKQREMTLIVATHDMQRAYQFAGRIFLVFNKGVIETGSKLETQNSSDPRVQQFIHGWLHGPMTDSFR